MSVMPSRGGGLSSPPRMPRVPMRLWSATRWFITLNVVIFLADVMSFGRLSQWGTFSVDRAIFHGQVWRFATFQFLHAGTGHILFNMVALYYFGPLLERSLGRRAFGVFYIVCGLAGAAAYLLLWRLGMLHVTAESGLIGASASILGVMAAATAQSPGMAIWMIFPPVQVRLSTLLWIFLGIAFVTIWTAGPNAGGEAAHLGGAAAGFVLIKNVGWLKRAVGGRASRRFWKPGDPQSNFFREEFRR